MDNQFKGLLMGIVCSIVGISWYIHWQIWVCREIKILRKRTKWNKRVVTYHDYRFLLRTHKLCVYKISCATLSPLPLRYSVVTNSPLTVYLYTGKCTYNKYIYFFHWLLQRDSTFPAEGWDMFISWSKWTLWLRWVSARER